MKLSEFFKPHQTSHNIVKSLSGLGALSFGKSITDKNQTRTPHYEIKESFDMLENNILINSGVNQLIEFIIPNKKMKVFSNDKISEDFVNKWYSYRQNILGEIKNLLKTNFGCGNAPLEKYKVKTVDGCDLLDNIFSYNDMTRIYINPDDVDGTKAYLLELPIGQEEFYYMNKLRYPQFEHITYIKNYQYTFERVYGVWISKEEMEIYKSGWSRDNIYGRSQLMSGIDVHNIYKELLSTWDTIAKTRQLDKKIITPASGEEAFALNDKQREKLEEELEDSDKSYTIFNMPLKLLQQDIETSGKYDTMENVFDIIRRLIMFMLLPQHLTPWSDGATTQGAESAMPAFLGRVKAKQNELINFLDNVIIGELRKTYTWLANDLTHVFDEPKVLADENYVRMVSDLIREGIINAKAARNYLNNMGILNDDIFKNAEEEKINDDNFTTEFFFLNESLKPNITFDTFLTRIKKADKRIDTSDWKEKDYKNIGGKDVRLIYDQSSNEYYIYDGGKNVQNFNVDIIELKTIRQAFADYIKTLKKAQEEFESGETEEDKAIETLRGYIKQELDQNLSELMNLIDRNSVKHEKFSEKFVSPNILKGLNNFFTGFTKKINSMVNDTLNKMSVSIIKGEDDNLKSDDDLEDMIREKRDLMKKSIGDQIKTTKNNMLVDIKSTITQSISAGQTINDIKKNVKKRYNYEDGVGYKFDTIIRTSTRSSSTLLKLRKWQKMGFEHFEWITVEDDKVREDHRKRNKRVYKIQDALDGKIPYPGGSLNKDISNYNCRCRAAPY